jgi:hypothetical protein
MFRILVRLLTQPKSNFCTVSTLWRREICCEDTVATSVVVVMTVVAPFVCERERLVEPPGLGTI